MSKNSHGIDFQRQVLNLMFQDEKFCAKASEFLKESFFGGELKWFFRKMSELYTTYNRRPSDKAMQSEMEKHVAEYLLYKTEYAEIRKCEYDEDYLKKELTSWIRANLFVEACKEAVNIYNSGNREQSYSFTQERLDTLLKIDFEKERTSEFGDGEYEKILGIASLQKSGAIPTGITGIDQAMGGGLFPQTWTTFLGGSNAGKSMLMPTLAYYAALNEKNTFVTIHEDEEIPTKMRFYSRFTGIPFSRLFAPDLTDTERDQLRTADSMMKKHVKLRFMYTKESTIEAVQSAARNLHRDWPFDLFLCDYGQCLTTNKFKSLDNTRLIQEHIYHELKQLCLELQIAGAGGAQVNRAGHAMAKTGADLLRMTDVGESWGICKKSSNVITMNRSDEDAKNNRITFLLDKVRNGICPVAVECETDYASCTTHHSETGKQQILQIGLSRVSEPKE